MKIYHYHPETGTYLGESTADVSPLEPGNYLIPAYATPLEPLEPVDDKLVVFDDEAWIYVDVDTQPDIDLIKQLKIDELWQACNQAILSGFHSEVSGRDILYGFDEMDQSNLTQQLVMIASGLSAEPIFWKGKGETELLPYTVEQFKQLCADGQAHKVSHMYRYYQLKDSVRNSESIEDIEFITWQNGGDVNE